MLESIVHCNGAWTYRDLPKVIVYPELEGVSTHIKRLGFHDG